MLIMYKLSYVLPKPHRPSTAQFLENTNQIAVKLMMPLDTYDERKHASGLWVPRIVKGILSILLFPLIFQDVWRGLRYLFQTWEQDCVDRSYYQLLHYGPQLPFRKRSQRLHDDWFNSSSTLEKPFEVAKIPWEWKQRKGRKETWKKTALRKTFTVQVQYVPIYILARTKLVSSLKPFPAPWT